MIGPPAGARAPPCSPLPLLSRDLIMLSLYSLVLFLPAQATETPKPAAPKYEVRKVHDRDGIGKFYMDREIAQVMGHEGAGWLERPEREKEEHPAKLIRRS